MSAAAAARRAARAARRMANGLDNIDWSMPNGIGGSPLDNLEINPNRADDLDVMPEDLVDPDLVDPSPVVPDNWEDVIPTDITLRPGEDPNLAGAATPIDLVPDIDTPAPRPRAPNDMPGTRPSRPSPDLDDAVPNPNAAPEPSDARARALALATLGGAGIVSMYDFFPPGGATPDGFPPTSPPTESPPGGDFRFDPPFPGPDGRNDPGNPNGAAPVMGSGRPGWEEPRIRRLANRAGIPYAQALAMVQAGYDEQSIGHVVDKKSANPDFYQRRQAYGTLRQLGHDRRDQDRRDRQAEVVARAQRQYNPMATLSPEWRDFVMAERLLRDSRNVGASPNDVRARQLDAATRLAASAVQQSIRNGMGGPQLQWEQQQLEEAKRVKLRQEAEKAANALWGWATDQERREAADKALRAQGAGPADRQEILDEMYPVSAPPPAVAPGSVPPI